MFVFDRQFHTVPDEGHICSGFYYEKTQYMPNLANGVADDGILGHGSLFVDIFASGTSYKTILTDDITNEANLLYLIEPWPMFNGLEHVEDIRNPKLWHITLKHIPEKIIQLAREKRLTIILHIPEFVSGLHIIKENLDITVKLLNIPETQFKFVSGMRTDGWYYWPGFEYSQFVCYNDVDVVSEINLNERARKFTCLNRVDKMHRRYIATELWRYDLIDYGYFSYSFGRFGFEDGEYKLIKIEVDDRTPETISNLNITESNWRQFYYNQPWTADTLTIEEHNHHWHVEQNHYNNAYWNYVTETGVEEYPFLSEKTFKPIANLQPFIILGGYRSLATLRDLGYKTFGDYIDESYDEIFEPGARIQRATHQAAQLARLHHNDHVALIRNMKPILEHNQQHFFKSKNRFGNFVIYLYGNNPAHNWLEDCTYDRANGDTYLRR